MTSPYGESWAPFWITTTLLFWNRPHGEKKSGTGEHLHGKLLRGQD
jgi:hypothetical protein